MKQILSLVFAGIVGGVVTLGGYVWLVGNTKAEMPATPSYVKQVKYVNTGSGMGFNVPFDFTEAAAQSMPAVVHIAARESQKSAHKKNQKTDPFSRFFGEDFLLDSPFFNYYSPKQGTGSGVIYSEDGYIITNNHVIEFADEIEVTTFDNKKYQASIVGTYPDADLAVLKIEEKNLPTLRLANSDEAKVGEWVLAVGNPLDLTSTVTAGIISAKGRNINIIKGRSAIETFLQTDAAVNPGNSGGALVDASGRLLGINTAIATKTGFFDGYSFAIPVNLVVKIVDDIIENGSYQRGYLGINIADLDDETAKELGLGISQGVLVESLVDGGSAQYAGLLPNDVITEVNGKKVKSTPDLLEIIGGAKVGDTVILTINRAGKTQLLSVKLKAAN